MLILQLYVKKIKDPGGRKKSEKCLRLKEQEHTTKGCVVQELHNRISLRASFPQLYHTLVSLIAQPQAKTSAEAFLETFSIHKYVLLDNENKAIAGLFYLKEGGSRYIRNADNNLSAIAIHNEEKFQVRVNSHEDLVLVETQ